MIVHYWHLALFLSIGHIIAADNILEKLDLLGYDKVCLNSAVAPSPEARRRMMELCRESPSHHYNADNPLDQTLLQGQKNACMYV